jgi:uncharacterized protein (TIGR03437 family)
MKPAILTGLLAAGLAAHAGAAPKGMVILLNGFQSSCGGTGNSSSTFGQMETLLKQEGYEVRFFNNCDYTDKLFGVVVGYPKIEELGRKLGEVIAGLKFSDGSPVTQVDLVAHSMGGLISRCYLTGKKEDGTFQPPANPKVRKLITLGTPHFGTDADYFIVMGGNPQVQAMKSGSRFLWDLATWNQGRDDLREVDALAIAGNGGKYNGKSGYGDGLVAITSAALAWSLPGERIRVTPYCHSSGGSFGAMNLCSTTRGVANVDAADHLGWRLVKSFLNGTDEWHTAAPGPADDAVLRTTGGLLLGLQEADDNYSNNIGEVTYDPPFTRLANTDTGIYYDDFFPAAQSTVRVAWSGKDIIVSLAAFGGGYRAASAHKGPQVYGIAPVAAAVKTLNRTAGMMIAIYGSQLGTGSETAPSLPLPTKLAGTTVTAGDKTLGLYYAGDAQINAVLPDGLSGVVKLTIQNANGKATWNVYLEAAVPAVFAADRTGTGMAAAVNAVTGQVVSEAAALAPGDYVSLFATGLGAATPRDGVQWSVVTPTVSIDGQPAEVTFAGRTPEYPGLDQINVRVPAGARRSNLNVSVASNGRTSNTVWLPVR